MEKLGLLQMPWRRPSPLRLVLACPGQIHRSQLLLQVRIVAKSWNKDRGLWWQITAFIRFPKFTKFKETMTTINLGSLGYTQCTTSSFTVRAWLWRMLPISRIRVPNYISPKNNICCSFGCMSQNRDGSLFLFVTLFLLHDSYQRRAGVAAKILWAMPEVIVKRSSVFSGLKVV